MYFTLPLPPAPCRRAFHPAAPRCSFLPPAAVCVILARAFHPRVSLLVLATFACYAAYTVLLTWVAAGIRRQVKELDNEITGGRGTAGLGVVLQTAARKLDMLRPSPLATEASSQARVLAACVAPACRQGGGRFSEL